MRECHRHDRVLEWLDGRVFTRFQQQLCTIRIVLLDNRKPAMLTGGMSCFTAKPSISRIEFEGFGLDIDENTRHVDFDHDSSNLDNRPSNNRTNGAVFREWSFVVPCHSTSMIPRSSSTDRRRERWDFCVLHPHCHPFQGALLLKASVKRTDVLCPRTWNAPHH